MASPQALAAIAPYAGLLGERQAGVATDLESLCELLTKWNRAQNLVSRETTVDEIWHRHIADSLRVLPLLRDADEMVADVGSGGGFPALPLAIAAKGLHRSFRLIEPNAKKVSFLRAVIRALGLNATVESRRAGEAEVGVSPDVVTSRAVAALGPLLTISAPLFGAQTRGLFHKGREYPSEVEEAAAIWRFDVIIHGDKAGADGVILEISNLQRHQ